MRTEPCSGWIDSDRSEARGVDIRCDIRGRYFYISGDEVRRPGSKLVVQAVWYGMTRTPFTWDLSGTFLATDAPIWPVVPR